MVEENDPASNGGKKSPQTKHYPFGTSTSFSYSKFSHLSGDVYDFATSLAGTASDIKPEIGQKTIVKTPTKKKSSSTAPAKKDDESDFLKTLGATEEGVKPCDRKDCKEVIKKIIERQSKNKYERDDMEADTDKCLADIEYYETQNSNIEERVKSLVRQENQLQQTVDHLAIELEKLEKSKNEIQSERDGYVNKTMVLETEKQNWIRDLQTAQQELADAMWRGQKKVDSSSLSKQTMVITRSDEKTINSLKSISDPDYEKLAGKYVFDYNERPITIPTIPYFIQAKIAQDIHEDLFTITSKPSFLRLGTGMDWSDSYASTPSIRTKSRHSHSIGKLSPISKKSSMSRISEFSLEKTLNKVRARSPFLQLPNSSFKGYTPTGSPTNRRGQSAYGFNDDDSFYTQTSMDDNKSSMAPSKRIDPVFYKEQARASFGRKSTVGKLRIRKGDNQLDPTPNKTLSYKIGSKDFD